MYVKDYLKCLYMKYLNVYSFSCSSNSLLLALQIKEGSLIIYYHVHKKKYLENLNIL